MFKKFAVLCFISTTFLVVNPFSNFANAKADGSPKGVTGKIAAVVNKDIVTLSDLKERIRLIISSSNMPNNSETVKSLTPQVLKMLIDERLQLQAASERGVNVSDEELNRAISEIERNNGMKQGELLAFLASKKLSIEILKGQVQANIAWIKYVRDTFYPNVNITEEDVDAVVEKLEASLGEARYHLSEIFLPIDDPKNIGSVKHEARELVSQLKKGASFPALAQQFSKSPSSANGGNIGWVSAGQFASELGTAASKLKKGEVSDPIRTNTGYYILFLKDFSEGGKQKEVRLTVHQLTLPIYLAVSEEYLEEQLAKVEGVRAKISSVVTLEKAAKSIDARIETLKDVTAEQLHPELRRIVESLPVGTPSPMIRTSDGGGIIFVSARKEVEKTVAMPEREALQQQLAEQRLDSYSRRSMRDLRRSAFIDIRI
ncbi:MAG: hypothetical protein HOI80_03915 [Alphaproteobacteria bacterium]|jgi:peptidyl-prolyl cis-trans isomerase SurA|nr:hypothetical protein [Alphaproteobacteria bacterium]MBT5389325.1 hypothetical protein [Alphaproteobacteria bacterium]MBT5541136.1 hypothetical protein [Alphaproteobacteria bacterium]MBT5654631.1 hypothetical protein [Alphaproteobacteria bacterium]